MLYKTAFDTICHEHIEYYCLRQIRDLLQKYGLRIFSVEFNGSNGGSFRCYVCHRDADYQNIDKTLDEVIASEQTDFPSFNKKIGEAGGKIVFFLADPKFDVRELYAQLSMLNPPMKIALCENLGYPQEHILIRDIRSPPQPTEALYSLVIGNF